MAAVHRGSGGSGLKYIVFLEVRKDQEGAVRQMAGELQPTGAWRSVINTVTKLLFGIGRAMYFFLG